MTYFTNFGDQHYNQALNNIDPPSSSSIKVQLNQYGGESVLSLPESRP